MRNFSIRDEIQHYWSIRAESYDASPGHGLGEGAEREAWIDLLTRHLGPANGRQALDLACGTGVMTMLLHELGFATTGMDFTEPMMARARAKAAAAQADIAFRLRDVEKTEEPDHSYDVLVTRHLVWTLVDPAASFAEWRRILKPGGTLLIVDGDFVRKSWLDRWRPLLDRLFGPAISPGHASLTPAQWQAHAEILQQVHFSNGARAEAVEKLLAQAGFENILVDADLRAIRRAQSAGQSLHRRLLRHTQHRFAVVATAPV